MTHLKNYFNFISFQSIKSLTFLLIISSLLILAGCEELENFDSAEECEKELKTTTPIFSSQDLSPCPSISSYILVSETDGEDQRSLEWDVMDIDNKIYGQALSIAESTSCSVANIYFDHLKASADSDTDGASKISNIYDEFYLLYKGADKQVKEICGRIDNIVIRLWPEDFECSKDLDSTIELFNNIGARAIK